MQIEVIDGEGLEQEFEWKWRDIGVPLGGASIMATVRAGNDVVGNYTPTLDKVQNGRFTLAIPQAEVDRLFSYEKPLVLLVTADLPGSGRNNICKRQIVRGEANVTQ